MQRKLPGLHHGEALKKKRDAESLHTIANGKGKMTGFAKQLTTEEKPQVLEYMKTLGR
jgi:mono/diheme cytochrome c family protein